MKAMDQISNAVKAVQDGELNALKCYIELKKIQKHLAECVKSIQEEALDERLKHPEKSIELHGVKIEVRNVGGKWNFSKLDWFKDFTEKQKEAKDAFKQWEKGKKLINDEGEVIQPAIYLAGKTTLFISNKNEDAS